MFLRGFSEAIGVAVVLVGTYLRSTWWCSRCRSGRSSTHPSVVPDWGAALTTAHGSPVMMVAVALMVFPQLALGLSGFETGVAVMPHVRGDRADTEDRPTGRIRGTKKLLTWAAVVMSVFLVASSFATTLLIPAAAFQPGGAANGRALAFLAHDYLGNGFGTAYDVSTIAILWFAGASAMAGLLNLIPRYLPRYGMAPEWAGAVRPLVLVLTGAAFLITWIFDADVDAQGGAYATGVLVLITSAAVAVTLAARRAGQRRLTLALRPDHRRLRLHHDRQRARASGRREDRRLLHRRDHRGLAGLSSRAGPSSCGSPTCTSTRRRSGSSATVPGAPSGWWPTRPTTASLEEYAAKERQIRRDHDLPPDADLVFVEVTVTDPSDFETRQDVHGVVLHGRYRVLTLESSSVANALAALLLEVRDLTGVTPHVYLEWTEGSPLRNFWRFLLLGLGEVAPTTREVLRRAEPDRSRRPHVHVG